MKRVASIAFLLIACIASRCLGLSIPAPPGEYVADYAGLLKPEERTQLNDNLRDFEGKTTDQVVVAIFPRLEQEDLEDFTNRVFIAWKIGQKQKDNGVLLAVFVKERRVRIEVGYGLEGGLTDALSSRIIRNELAPEFQAGNYNAGIVKAITAIEKAIQGEYKAPEEPAAGVGAYVPVALFVLFLILVMIVANRNRARSRYWRRGPFDDWWFIPGGRWGGGGGFGGFGGGGGFSGGSGGGGFSGGGGSSGGGGASGGW
jgi:uncharacterized protein